MTVNRYGGCFRQSGGLVNDELQTFSSLEDLVDIVRHHILHLVHLGQYLACEIRRRAVEPILHPNRGETPTISTFSEEANAVKQKGCWEYTASLTVKPVPHPDP